MAEEFAVVIAEKLVEKLIDPIIRQFSYVFCYNSNIKSFTECSKDLQDKKSDVMLRFNAHRRNLDSVGQDVVSWLRKVEENDGKGQEILQGTKVVKNGCRWCPSLKQRYLVSRKAVKQIMVVKQLQSDGEKHTQFAYDALPKGIVAPPPSRLVKEVFESRILQTQKVIEALDNKSILKVGVCGLGGVGKSRMANDICNRAIAKDLFDEVAMAVVTENPDPVKIQDQLAAMLGLKLDEKIITAVRGDRLFERLTNGKRILVILDDVWGELDLKKLGIPDGGQTKSNGCKVLVTARDEHTCNAMKTDKIFVVKLLSEAEAWDLFKEKSGVVVKSDLCETAKKICEECGGLPLAIVTVSTALINKDIDELEDALTQLQESDVISIRGMEKDLYSRLRLSYNLLENNQLRQLFLLCCIFPEDYDIPVEQLVRYAVGLRLFTNKKQRKTPRKTVKSLVNQLKQCYLLLASDMAAHVKVHDVLRDFGLNEASHGKHVYMSEHLGEHVYLSRHHGEVQQLFQTETMQSHTAISIGIKGDLNLPPGLECLPSEGSIELSNEGCIELSRRCFGEMKELRAVSFCGQLVSFDPKDMLIESPPKTLQFCMNVRTLCLENCHFSAGVGFIGRMQQLEILSFFRSEIDELPIEIGQLKNLKLLDLRHCILDLISPGVLSSLESLEDLYTGSYFLKEGVGESNNNKCAIIEELCSLPALKTLQLYISGPEVCSKLQDFFFDKLTSFDISINAEREYATRDPVLYFPNTARIKGLDLGMFAQAKMEALLRRAEKLHVSNVDGWNTKYIVSHIDVCKDLKELVVQDTTNLEEIFNGILSLGCQVRSPCCENLNVFVLTGCHNVRSLFSASMVRCLVQLQELRISECDKLEEIFIKYEAQGDEDPKVIKFPKLKNISFYTLLCFRSFYSASRIISPEVGHGGCIFSKDALLPSIETLSLGGPLVFPYDPEMMPIEQPYEGMETFKNLDTLIDLEGVEVLDINAKFLGQLEKINISNVRLKHICKNIPKQGLNEESFCNLRVLRITECSGLKHILCPTIAKKLVNLREMEVSSCKDLEQVITAEEVKEDIATIEFPQLWKLRLDNLRNLTAFYQGRHNLKFPLLVSAHVCECDNMEKFCSGSSVTQKLKSVRFGFGSNKSVPVSDLNYEISQRHKKYIARISRNR